MSENHQLLQELRAICKQYGINPGKAALAFELYIELCEVNKLWDVEHHFFEKLNTFYFTGKPKEKDESYNAYIPVTVDETLSLKQIEELQKSLSPVNKSLILVFRDQDSSSTHYRITNGLMRPDSPITAQRKKTEDRKSMQFKKCLTKWQRKLYTKALEDEKKNF